MAWLRFRQYASPPDAEEEHFKVSFRYEACVLTSRVVSLQGFLFCRFAVDVPRRYAHNWKEEVQKAFVLNNYSVF